MKGVKGYVTKLKSYLEAERNLSEAAPMKKYMRGQFEFLGIKSPERKKLLTSFLKENGSPEQGSLGITVKQLWNLPEREYQYCAMELAERNLKHMNKTFLPILEFMILNKSWWDSVDFVAVNLAGQFFRKFQEFIPSKTDYWCESENMWLNRSAILFQLKYKNDTNKDLLSRYINLHSGSKEFFIQKAIGWSLREYSKTEPQWVKDFISGHDLAPLSLREGLKWMNRKTQA